jgi:hypothetical protein
MSITAEEFAAQRQPRRGRANPERMHMSVWEWLVGSGLNAWQAAQRFNAPSALEVGPGWCFDRFGCSRTTLPDGRIVRIAGEHEDYYDPDFYIYNDVVVLHADGAVEIYGYPEDIFPPTDFHSATLIEGEIWIVGGLGYTDQRRPGTTPVHVLDVDSLAIRSIPTTGHGPGWLFRHTAEHIDAVGGIVVQRGVVETDTESRDHRDNIDDWLLELPQRHWRRLTARPWQQWTVRRVDGEDLMLFYMQSLAFDLENPKFAASRSGFSPGKELGERRRYFDLDLFRRLFRPPIDCRHEDPASSLDDDENEDAPDDNTRNDTARLFIGETMVRYADENRSIAIKIEGDISSADLHTLVNDIVDKLSRLQGVRCAATQDGPPTTPAP